MEENGRETENAVKSETSRLSFSRLFEKFDAMDKDIDEFALLLSQYSENDHYVFRQDSPIGSVSARIDPENKIFYLVCSGAPLKQD